MLVTINGKQFAANTFQTALAKAFVAKQILKKTIGVPFYFAEVAGNMFANNALVALAGISGYNACVCKTGKGLMW